MKNEVTVGGVDTYRVDGFSGRVNLHDLQYNVVTNMSVREARCLAAALHDPLVSAMAMSLYQFNIGRFSRADALYQHFNGDCAEMSELLELVDSKNWATNMAAPTAAVYLRHAIERYGDEAWARVEANRG